MLSSILKSEKAALVNISIMRIFTKLRSFLMMERENSIKISTMERGTNQLFKVVFERLDNLEESLPVHPRDRKRIGLKNRN
jgi:2-hydroxy-3-keto-5-methylthiopentenyl-1-phosphate phosphatase